MTANPGRKILIVNSDYKKVVHLHDLIEFVDYQAECMDTTEYLDKGIDYKSYLAIVIENDDNIIDQACDKYSNQDGYPPFVVLDNDPESVEQYCSSKACVLSCVDYQPNYYDLVDTLHKAEIYAANREDMGSARMVELFRSLVGNSRGITYVRRMIEQVAPTEATVLILGESGTGKEVVARNIHYYSSRRDKPFVPINCGAIPAELLESELFGHEKGAFTGAITARQGRFELAEGGTLFLDEIGDMPLNMQVKLLRVLQEKSFERVGGSKSIDADVRVIAATHRDLHEQIEKGDFREDLYYRLNVFPVDVPPLRDRAEDLPLLIHEIITRMEHNNQGSVRFTPASILALVHYSWPGNVRELANLVERLAILFPYGVVDISDLPDKYVPEEMATATTKELEEQAAATLGSVVAVNQPVRLPKEGINLKEYLIQIEKDLIRQAVDEENGVVAQAAKRLQIRRTTLVEKMRKYQIERPGDSS